MPERLDVRLDDANAIGQQFRVKVTQRRASHQSFIGVGPRNAETLRLALERHDQPHRDPVILSRPPLGDIDLDELLSSGSYGMPILQRLGLEGVFIENLFGREEGGNGCGFGERGDGQPCHGKDAI